MRLDLKISPRQEAFIAAEAEEVLFGGAAGGGKSYGQIVDALLFALRFPGSKQLILRRTFPELDKSLIRVALGLYPAELFSYNSSSHTGRFTNGSLIDFGYCDSVNDVYRYQSAEYDVIRFDELTHFTEQMYVYLLSRVRGANSFPKQVKSSTNPGGVGHSWVKRRFIDLGAPDVVHETPGGSRVFLPSRVQDNQFLMQADPEYVRRLENLSDRDKRALLYGDWDIFEGQYFSEWDRAVHVVRPFAVPKEWRRYFAMDYGLDMLAGYWIAMDHEGRAYVYREIYRPGLIISDAARAVREMNGDDEIYAWIGPPDLWNRRQDTGKSAAEIFAEHGVPLVKAANDRVQGWYALKEWLKPVRDAQGGVRPHLMVFDHCVNLIRTLPAVQVDQKDPNDVAGEPHELTHAPDAIRYFVAGRPMAELPPMERDPEVPDYDQEVDSFLDFGV